MAKPISNSGPPQSAETDPSSATATKTPSPFQPVQHEISVRELKQKLDQGEPILLIDVREPLEHQIVHLDEALLIPLNNLPQQADQLDPNREIVIYCHHGMRSMQATYYLYQLGFQNVKSLSGGIDHWAIEINPTLNRY